MLADGENITEVHTKVKPVDYIDSLARQHDINYQYFERVFANDPAKLNQALWAADKAAVLSALQFTPTNWMERDYREMFINAFIKKAQVSPIFDGYGDDPQIVAEAQSLAAHVRATDPSVRALGAMEGLQINGQAKAALEQLFTSGLSSHRNKFFSTATSNHFQTSRCPEKWGQVLHSSKL